MECSLRFATIDKSKRDLLTVKNCDAVDQEEGNSIFFFFFFFNNIFFS